MPEISLGGALAGGEMSEVEWEDMVERVSKSAFKVVALACTGTEISSGSGFSVGGLVVTNQHVIEDAKRVVLISQDSTRIEVARWVDAGSDDLALLEPSKSLNTPNIRLALDDPRSGDLIAAVGYPLGGELTVRRARILDRIDEQELSATFAVSTSASVQPGDSGGILVDASGNVVAVTTAIALKKNVSLAVPVSRLQNFIEGAVFPESRSHC